GRAGRGRDPPGAGRGHCPRLVRTVEFSCRGDFGLAEFLCPGAASRRGLAAVAGLSAAAALEPAGRVAAAGRGGGAGNGRYAVGADRRALYPRLAVGWGSGWGRRRRPGPGGARPAAGGAKMNILILMVDQLTGTLFPDGPADW